METKERGRDERRAGRVDSTGGGGRALRWMVPAGGGAAVIAAILLATPLAGAAGPIASFAAPYTGGVAVHIRDATVQGCGASLLVPVPAAFSLTNGHAKGQASSKSGPCATSDSQATYDGTVGVKGLAFSAAASGTYTVRAAWTATWNASATMNGAAATAGAQATVEIRLWVKLVDLTAHTTLAGKNVWLVQKDLRAATSFAAGAAGASYAATLGASLVAGHSYAVMALLEFSAQTAVPQGSASASLVTAAVDLGSTGHGADLASVTVA